MRTFTLKPPRRPPARQMLLPALMLTVFALLFAARFTSSTFILVGAGLLAPALVLLFWWLQHKWASCKERTVGLSETSIILPGGGKGTVELPLEGLRSVLARGQPRPRMLIIEADAQDFWIERSSFDPPEAFDALLKELNQRILALPDGEARFQAMAERARVSDETFSRPATLTRIILGALIVIYLIEHQLGALDRPFELVALGANAPTLIFEQRQWFRLISGNFLHANLLHIGLNGLAILNLGTAIERMIGPARLLLVYMGAAIGGAITSALLAAGSHSVGASTAVFGLLGAFGVITLRFSSQMPIGLRQTKLWWVQVLGVNAALPFLIPQIDGAAHAGGFLAGVLFALLFVPARERLPIQKPGGAPLLAAIGATVGLCAFGLVGVIARYPSAKEDVRAVLEAHLKTEKDPEALNYFAWQIAIDPRASAEELRLGAQAAQRAMDRSEGTLETTDTLATLRFRLGQLEEAIALEQGVYARAQDDYKQVYASQLARFLRARPEAPRLFARLLDPSADPLRFEVEDRRDEKGAQDAARIVFALVLHKERLIGLAVLPLPAGQARASLSLPAARLQTGRAHLWPSLPPGPLELWPARISAGVLPADLQPMDEEVAGWP